MAKTRPDGSPLTPDDLTTTQWDELKKEFRSVPDPMRRFQIVFPHEEKTDPRVLAGQFGDDCVRYVTNGMPTEAGVSARAAAHFAAAALKGQHFVDTAILTGGLAIKDVHKKFCDLAHRGARMAGLVDSTATDEEAVQAWCDRLRRRGFSYQLGTLADPIEASALLCVDFGTRQLPTNPKEVESVAGELTTPPAPAETSPLPNDPEPHVGSGDEDEVPKPATDTNQAESEAQGDASGNAFRATRIDALLRKLNQAYEGRGRFERLDLWVLVGFSPRQCENWQRGVHVSETCCTAIEDLLDRPISELLARAHKKGLPRSSKRFPQQS